ncbi:unnamed protein product [Brassicogethes aeneus]|uniref:Uncharacterized protein n=1 Tax=Brassicogethes aeneus TaxID=1431903 RepID=A0A9P0FN90_BRAAE|nr:unnamed protein product [Brassicogethes aeneus]
MALTLFIEWISILYIMVTVLFSETFVYSNQLLFNKIDQRTSCAGLESAGRKKPPPLLRSRTLPAIVVPGVNILHAHLGTQPDEKSPSGRISFSRDDSVALDLRRKSAISRLCTSANYGPERSSDGTILLRVPAPHIVAAKALKVQSPGGSNTALFKIGKLLSQGCSKNQIVVDDTNVTRRLSWERRGTISSRLPRSSSIDSMVEAVWSESQDPPIEPIIIPEKRPSLRPDRTLALVSPSVGRRMKGQRGVNGEWAK